MPAGILLFVTVFLYLRFKRPVSETVTVSIIAFAVSIAIYVFCFLIGCFIAGTFTNIDNNENRMLIANSIVSVLQILSPFLLFKIRRFRSGVDPNGDHTETKTDVPVLTDTSVWTLDAEKSQAPTHTADGINVYTSAEYGEVTVPVSKSEDAHVYGIIGPAHPSELDTIVCRSSPFTATRARTTKSVSKSPTTLTRCIPTHSSAVRWRSP